MDLYSLGIVFFEMVYPFRTGHERVLCIQVYLRLGAKACLCRNHMLSLCGTFYVQRQ